MSAPSSGDMVKRLSERAVYLTARMAEGGADAAAFSYQHAERTAVLAGVDALQHHATEHRDCKTWRLPHRRGGQVTNSGKNAAVRSRENLNASIQERVESIRKYATYFSDGKWHAHGNVAAYERTAFHDLLWLITEIEKREELMLTHARLDEAMDPCDGSPCSLRERISGVHKTTDTQLSKPD